MRNWSSFVGRLVPFAVAALLTGCEAEVPETSPAPVPEHAEERFDWEALSPEVADYIKDNYLSHKAEFPDADEPLSALRTFIEGQELLAREDVDGALALFQAAVVDAPQSRHAHAGLGRALLRKHALTADAALLARAADSLERAHALALGHGRIRYTDELARALGALKAEARLDAVFQPLLKREPSSWLVSLDYAAGLNRAGSERAGEWYAHAAQVRPGDVPTPAVEYAKWLLERRQPAEAFAALEPHEGEDFAILHYYRGLAAERLGDGGRAQEEYAKAVHFSQLFPLSQAWHSRLAAGVGVQFQNEVQAQTHCPGHDKMSELLYCEARGEGRAGMRAVGWVLRTRAFRGTERTGCIVDNSGDTACAKYLSVGTQRSQFAQCGTRDDASDATAYNVFYGIAADPYAQWCAEGTASSTTWCSATCSAEQISGASANGPSFFYATSGSCPSRHPSGCGSNPKKTCGNGGSDNCFYDVD